MTEYSRMAKGHFTSTGQAQVVPLPFLPDRVELLNLTAVQDGATSQVIPRAFWDVSMGQGTAVIEGYNATPALVFDYVATHGISTYAAGQLLQFGPVMQHGSSIGDFSISKATAAVVTTTNPHGLTSGNVVIFQNLYESNTTGMTQMTGIPLTVTVTGADTFTVDWNTSGSNYTAFSTSTSAGNAGSYKQVLYPYIYAPSEAIITAINTSTGVITTAAAHNFQVGQSVAFRIPAAWGSVQLNSLPDALIPGSPIYYTVIAVTQNTFTVSQSLLAVTAFTSNVAFNATGLTPAQVVAVGDVNSGGYPFTGGQLYPSPTTYTGFGASATPTINGPAIQGAFLNASSQGFTVGAGAGAVLTTGSLVGSAADVVYWVAYLDDLQVN